MNFYRFLQRLSPLSRIGASRSPCSAQPRHLSHFTTTSMSTSRRSARLSAGNGDGSATTLSDVSMPPPPTKARGKRKAPDAAGAADSQPAPATPPRKRRTTKDAAAPPPPPATPTPSAVGVIVQPVTPKSTKTKAGKANRRVANPLATNAPLISPETSRIIAPKRLEDVSPSKAQSITTSANLLEEACAHLIKVDPRMRPLVVKHHCRMFSPEGLAERIDPFESLASGIISQQVSGAAARAIKGRFIDLFGPPANGTTAESSQDDSERVRFPHPSQVVRMPMDKLRGAGLSQRKSEYILGLAEKFTTGALSAALLAEAPYEEVLERLTAVRGLGRWSAEMFACFGLKRMDVFSLGDLGVQRGCAAFVGRDVAKLKNKGGKWKYMNEQDMVELSDRFKPYRTLFMWYMWRAEDTDVTTME